ncbi:MAG: CoB--CoM heterodisulfide reductase iron-sulfur subunit B family protein [Candidatus Cloacimonetes bacterium]|nr:CoB--CoM heterodisulfide reductase iron-sulfur subunit B family protein [Candidatus Cloacimonadota bacterium]
MKLSYYPGCTLKANARHFEESAVRALQQLDYQLEEMQDWVCCGTVFSMTSDDLMLQLSSIRNLLRAEDQGLNELIVLCSMCYNTLKRSNDFITSSQENLEKVNNFMYMENMRYEGRIKIYHLFTLLRERIGFELIRKKVVNPLNNLKLGAYYGCLLVRPEEYAIDSFEDPTIIEDFLTALGAETRDYPYKLECCGAYQTITKKDISIKRAYEILNSAWLAGCEAIVTSCPLCAYNLDFLQKDVEQEYVDFNRMPVFYFTELMSVALGGGWDAEWSKLHSIDPEPLLKEKDLI